MTYGKLISMFFACVVLASDCAWAGDIKIIANSSVGTSTISPDELRSVFLEERNSLADGTHVEPVLQKSGGAHEAFTKEYLGKSDSALQTYYRTLVFTGRGSMPKTAGSDAEVVAYVARTKGAIGYITAASSVGQAKELVVLSDEARPTRTLLTRVEPEYPEVLKARNIGGIVKFKISISPQGEVETLVPLGGNPILVESASRAIRQWVYAPSSSRTSEIVTLTF